MSRFPGGLQQNQLLYLEAYFNQGHGEKCSHNAELLDFTLGAKPDHH